jgi:hypothetical protein
LSTQLAQSLDELSGKTCVGEVGGGVLGRLSSWLVYGLMDSAIAGFVLPQSGLKTGVLASEIASSNSVTLFASVALGITVYVEHLSKTGGTRTGSAFPESAIAVGGVGLLAGSALPEPAASPVLDTTT